ncbi:GDSL esterase/lipase [Spatholobus suberectus]|nr:GDSL esterase/lipase [Spatholobus suberectus]
MTLLSNLQTPPSFSSPLAKKIILIYSSITLLAKCSNTVSDNAIILVNQMANAARYLYDANARKIICLGILLLGCTPRMAWKLNRTSARDYNGNGCVDHVNDLVFEYNRLLKLNTESPDAHMAFCDVYNGMMDITNEPRLHVEDIMPEYKINYRESLTNKTRFFSYVLGIYILNLLIGFLSPEGKKINSQQLSTFRQA